MLIHLNLQEKTYICWKNLADLDFNFSPHIISGFSEGRPNDSNQNLHQFQSEELHHRPANFGKVFEKAHSIAKQKSETKYGGNPDCFLDKFKSRSKSKQTILPSNLSSLVSKHRRKYGEPDLADYDPESYDTVDGDYSSVVKSRTKPSVDDTDVFDNDFEKEFQKVIKERSTYTEMKSDIKRHGTVSKRDNVSHEVSDIDSVKSAKTHTDRTNEIQEKNCDTYDFEAGDRERGSPVKIVRGKRNRISRIKSTAKGNGESNKALDTNSSRNEIVEMDTDITDIKEGNDSESDSGTGKSGNRKSRKRKTQETDNESYDDSKAKRRKTTTVGSMPVGF